MKLDNPNRRLLPVLCLLLIGTGLAFVAPQPARIVFLGANTKVAAEQGGYIGLLKEMFRANKTNVSPELFVAGVPGDKVYDLYLRLEDEVLPKKPETVVILTGVNDVLNKTWGNDMDLRKFELFYRALIRKVKASGAVVVLCTPAVIGEKTDFSNPQDEDLNKYASIVLNLAQEEKCKLADLRAVFLKHNLIHNPGNKRSGILTTDGVRLNPAGNQLVAETIMEVLLNP